MNSLKPIRNKNKQANSQRIELSKEEQDSISLAYSFDEFEELQDEFLANLDSSPVLFTLGGNSILGFEGDAGEERLVSINGASIREDKRLSVSWNEITQTDVAGQKTAEGFKITIDGEAYLNEIFDVSPYGIIKKNRTGVGATTLELKADRNSIIVVPTKALAYNKAVDSRLPDKGMHEAIYVGSWIKNQKVRMPLIDEYLSTDRMQFKKFVVVADSLKKVIEAIGESVYNNYFLMVDEVDSFQSDSTYRKSLEDVIDYYLEWDDDKRCLVSATVKEFSNPELTKECMIELEYVQPKLRGIDMIHTNNPNLETIERIEHLYRTTNDKIVVAYNKVKFIRQVIENLTEECKADCAILCSTESEKVAGKEYYQNELALNKSPGIDISERYHLISVSNAKYIYTLLSPEKLKQIAGRCRDKDGLLSEFIIYNTKPYDGDIASPVGYKEYILRYADEVRQYINQADEFVKRYSKSTSAFRNLISPSFLKVKDDILNRSSRHFFQGARIPVVRKHSLSDEYKIAYFNIDSVYETVTLRNTIYTLPTNLLEALDSDREIEVRSWHTTDKKSTKEQEQRNEAIDKLFDELEEDSLQKLIAALREYQDEGKLDDIMIGKIKRGIHRRQQMFIEYFWKLYPYVPFENLIEDLQNCDHKNEYRGYYNGAIFWALDKHHDFKVSICDAFKLNKVYSGEEIKEKITTLIRLHFDREIKTNIYARLLKEFINAHIVDRRKSSYRIISYNKNGYDFPPLKIIPPTEILRDGNLIELTDENPKRKKKKDAPLLTLG